MPNSQTTLFPVHLGNLRSMLEMPNSDNKGSGAIHENPNVAASLGDVVSSLSQTVFDAPSEAMRLVDHWLGTGSLNLDEVLAVKDQLQIAKRNIDFMGLLSIVGNIGDVNSMKNDMNKAATAMALLDEMPELMADQELNTDQFRAYVYTESYNYNMSM